MAHGPTTLKRKLTAAPDGTAVVTLTLDTSRLEVALDTFGMHASILGRALGRFGRALEPSRPHALELETAVSGREAKWYVRGAFDSRYAAPADRDRYAKTLARCGSHGPRLAAALLRGWAEHHDEPTLTCRTGCGYAHEVGVGTSLNAADPCAVHDSYVRHMLTFTYPTAPEDLR